ncbi:MAG: DNA mismatch repair endonuclease MutL [Clostridia bacterium]
MKRINVLDKSVAEKIAAGEVVERPQSVVKELVENSIDALATSVTVEIEKGGTSYIRVTDNGTGIHSEDVSVAFLRHATSKIQNETDLESIGTLGFRGEALCSISAVSRTELITKTAIEDLGTFMVVEGGETVKCEQTGCPLGTTVTVRNLFFNTPARYKFLKKDTTESAYITDVCQRVALSHPEVSFRYIRDGKEIFFTPGDNVLKNTVRAVFGKDISNALTEVSYTGGLCHITGLTCTNNLSRPNRNMQYFFVNGRLVKSAILSLAMSEAYKNELMVGRYPVCMIHINLPCDMVDVNVHPAKTEVKFVNEDEVYRSVVFAAKDAIVKKSSPKVQLRQAEKAFKMPVETKNIVQENFKNKVTVKPETSFAPIFEKEKPKEVKTSFTPIKTEKVAYSKDSLPVKKIESLAAREDGSFIPLAEKPLKKEKSVIIPKEEKAEKTVEIPDFLVVGQIFATYIIIQMDNEMIMIDQHAAHERINYERIKNKGCVKQTVLMPLIVNLSPNEKAAWLENSSFMDSMGFEGEDFGQDSVIVRTLPSDIDYEDGEGLFLEIINSFMGQGTGEISYLRDKAVYTIACKAAIKANKKLSEREMENLVKEVFLLQGISTCPHGRPIMVKMNKYQIEKMFKRIV